MDKKEGWSVCVAAPAKINLTLRVLGRRSDGFCELSSLVIGVGLTDTICFEECRSGRISLSCDSSELSDDEANLVMRAARLLAKRTGVHRGIRIGLDKSLPVGAGLGGGSSDAAATLDVLNRLWETGLAKADLSALGADLGSDVPLFFHLPAAVVRGRGEVVEPVRLRWSGWVVLLFGGVFVSTKAVYAALETANEVRPADGEAIEAILQATQAEVIGPCLYNDLEPAVFRVSPAVERLFHQVRALGGRFARVSGAGSTIYRLFDDEAEACAWADELRLNHVGAGVAVVRAPGGAMQVS